jgi:hypothetical protein
MLESLRFFGEFLVSGRFLWGFPESRKGRSENVLSQRHLEIRVELIDKFHEFRGNSIQESGGFRRS